MRKLTLILLLTCTIIPVMAQSNTSREELFNEGEYFFWRQDYQEALHYYLQLHKRFPDNANFNFKIGECYLNIQGKEPLAIPYFEKAVTNITSKKEYDRKDITEKKAPLHAYFYLGNAYRINNELGKALECYETFINHPYYNGNYNLTVVDNEIKASERAKIIQDSPVSIVSTSLSPTINTSADNKFPVVSADEQAIVYISALKFYEAVFYATKAEDGTWNTPVNISPQIGSDGDLYPSYLSPDGLTLILIKRQESNDDVYISKLNGDTWSKAEPISENINTRSNESFASLSNDGNTLLFTSERRSLGGSDIFISHKEAAGTWSKPENIGETLNTAFNEAAPYFANDDKTIYFSSQGHFNMGGYDIFYTNKDEKGNWSEPINLGYPINTTGDNMYFFPMGDGKLGYLSDIKPDGRGGTDIYRIEILSTLTHIFSKQHKKALEETSMYPSKKSFTLHIINELTKDTVGIIEFDRRRQTFSFVDYKDQYLFQFD